MSELHVRQIRAALEKELRKHIDISDVATRPPDEQINVFLTRSQMAFVFMYLASVTAEDAAKSITDGFGDNGIDGVLYQASERVLYIGQSKWRNDGTGSVDRGEMQKFLKGLRDLTNARWERFNAKIQAKAPDLETALNDASTRIVVVVAYTGQEPLSNEVDQDLQDVVSELNDPAELVTTQVLRQANIYSAVAQGIQGSPIDLEVALYDWGQVREPYSAFYGQVSAADIARWYDRHQNQLFAPNIRMFLGSTEVNTSIIDTLQGSPQDFWYFNNGVSALCRSIRKKPIGGNTRETGIFECHDLRIVNGAQTVGAIASAAQRSPDSVALARVAIRLVSLDACPADFDRKVTRYNNTQNRIDRRDFVALDIEQERIRGELQLEGVAYVYKSGETLTPNQNGFGLDEATVARACLQPDAALAVQAKREIGKLWEDITKAPYKILFNPSVNGPGVWRAVQIVRLVEAVLTQMRPNTQGRERLLTIHGNRFITHLAFQCLPKAILEAHQAIDSPASSTIRSTTIGIFREISRLLDEHYPDAYLATLFKNAGKCQYIKDAFRCP
jgi:hypothetical protein